MKRIILILLTWTFAVIATAQPVRIPFDKGHLQLTPLADNAVRICYEETPRLALPEWIYQPQTDEPACQLTTQGSLTRLQSGRILVEVDSAQGWVRVCDTQGKELFRATSHQLKSVTVGGTEAYEARLVTDSPTDEYLFGLGQFQDGQANVRGLTRRLTQVNTQIALPMYLSNRGYGVLWNNYGMTEFNPADHRVALLQTGSSGEREVVDVTSTEGGKKEVRESHLFQAEIELQEAGEYALLLDVGQQMARRHQLAIDGDEKVNLRNLWLPPTTSIRLYLTAGKHQVSAELEKEDKPVLYYKKVDNHTVLSSPVAAAVDYTVFVGTADEVIGSYRRLTGPVPLLPRWAMGYIHCRERFHSQDELLQTACQFREERWPVDVLVQDWQYWGSTGWNSMQFDPTSYPDPALMTDSLHRMGLRLMLSVWSKIDPASPVGKEMKQQGYLIPGTDWVDFFRPEAAQTYWKNFSQHLLKPYRIDAWWQDATEPENDDLQGRRIMGGRYPGEVFRNTYPLLVNKTVYEGLRHDDPERRALILTRSAFSGMQRYATATWSGDVGNDWQTLRYQLTAGLGMMAAGQPWWTYDAGGFFRPSDQHTDQAYIHRMLRWIEASVYLPLMRVHGYMSDTEPWRYGAEAGRIIRHCLEERYRLLPYIYSTAARVSFDGYTLMRPLLFDFATDTEALQQTASYLFGPSLLVNPVCEADVTTWDTYLPRHEAGWYDYYSGAWYRGGQHIAADVDEAHIPVFVKGGSILPIDPTPRTGSHTDTEEPLAIHIYPGADATFTLYEDEGDNYHYEQGSYSTISFRWDEQGRRLTIAPRQGSYPGMARERIFLVRLGKETQRIRYQGDAITIQM